MPDRSWFRHYNDAHHNRKLRALPEHTQLFYWWILELHSRNAFETANDAEIAWSLHIDETRVKAELDALRGAGLVVGKRKIKGWQERQFESDTSTPRVQKHRAKHRTKRSDETDGRNVSETLHETDQSRAEQNRAEQNIGATRARAREDSPETKIVSIGDNAPMKIPADQPMEFGFVLATDKQMSHLEGLTMSVGTTIRDYAANLGYRMNGDRPARAVAQVLIDRLRMERDNAKKPTTFLDAKMAANDQAFAKVLAEMEDDDG